MDQNRAETSEQVVKFTPKERPRSVGAPVEEVGQAVIANIQKSAELAKKDCEAALALAHRLAMQLRGAEDRANNWRPKWQPSENGWLAP